MELSIFIAKYAGLMYLAAGLGFLLSNKYYADMIKNIGKDKTSILFSGILSFFLGLTLVLFHNFWVADWTVIITILGWLGLIKGICLLVFPGITLKMADFFYKMKNFITIAGVFAIILGGVLTYYGFFA